MKPKLFIGSSREGREVANAVQENLERDAEVTVWDQGAFALSLSTMDGLLGVVGESDFGLFVFAPEDVSKIGGTEHRALRDNVVFELGLLIGRLGKERSFILWPDGQQGLPLPSDLLGIPTATYDAAGDNRVAALGPACNRVRKALGKLRPASAAVAPPPPEPELLEAAEEWTRRNQRRLHLIDRKYTTGLTPNEEAELTGLQTDLGAQLGTLAPLPFDSLRRLEALAEAAAADSNPEP